MAEDWRLRVQFEHETAAQKLTTRLQARDLEHDLESSFHDRVVVSRDGPIVFCYANSRDQAEAAQRAIEKLKQEHGWTIEIDLERWHPLAERWEAPDAELPDTPAERQQEHAELIESEREESREQKFPMFEVRVQCESHRDAEQLAEKLAAEGIPTVHRSQFVVAGADDEDAANALAERIRQEAPPGTTVTAEGSVAETAQDAPYGTTFSPFSVFGGLAG
ncbi:MAG TPA: hypothetical protein VMU39_13890 [Solirubrobacteraceae bacterium]|nr:hypothetical protein [Solirubrobacteraceae bacterium]